jgi:hypothetical protein
MQKTKQADGFSLDYRGRAMILGQEIFSSSSHLNASFLRDIVHFFQVSVDDIQALQVFVAVS